MQGDGACVGDLPPVPRSGVEVPEGQVLTARVVDMRRLETSHSNGESKATLDGVPVEVRIEQSIHAPHIGIWIDEEPQYDIEWISDGIVRGAVPSRSRASESVYAAFFKGDWSAIPRPDSAGLIGALRDADEAVKESAGYQARIAWSHVARIVRIAQLNAVELRHELDLAEDSEREFEHLSLEEHVQLDQQVFNLASSVDSIRDQVLKGRELGKLSSHELLGDVQDRTKTLWQVP